MSSNTTSTDLTVPINRNAIFILYIVLCVPSIPCSLLVFVQCFRKHRLLAQISTHVIIAVIIYSFFQVIAELPLVLYNLYTGTSLSEADLFCKYWSCLDYVCNVSILMLMNFGSAERYLLVFHRNFVHRHVLVIHYMPMTVCVFYPLILYIGLIFIYPCTNQFDYTMITCGGPCYFYEPGLSTFDQLVNIGVPLTVASIINVTLVIRVLCQKRRMKQQRIWKKNQRLILQLLSFVIIHNLIWMPLLYLTLIMLYAKVKEPILIQLNIDTLPYGIYIVVLLCPCILIFSLPELWPNSCTRRLFSRIDTHAVPATIPDPHMNRT